MLFVCSTKPTNLKNAICYNAFVDQTEDIGYEERRMGCRGV